MFQAISLIIPLLIRVSPPKINQVTNGGNIIDFPVPLTSELTVRKLTTTDLPALKQLCLGHLVYFTQLGQELNDTYLHHQLTAQPTTDTEKYLLGVFDNAGLVAVCDLLVGYPDEQTAVIGWLMVDITKANQGVGSLVVKWLKLTLVTHGIKEILLSYANTNQAGSRFWHQQVFLETGEIEHYPEVVIVTAAWRLTRSAKQNG